MNRTGLIVLVAAIAVVSAAAAYWYFGASTSAPEATAPVRDTMASAEPDVTPPAPNDSAPSAPPRDYTPPPANVGQGAPPPDYTSAPAEENGAAPQPPTEMTNNENGYSEPLAGGAPPPPGSGGSSSQAMDAAPPPPAPPPPPPMPPVLGVAPAAPPLGARPEPSNAPPLAPVPAAAPAMPQDIPIFPWPVPKASAAQEIPRRLVVAGDASPTFGTVAARLARALDRAGYNQHSYYAFAGGHGVAIATQLEQINDDGSPKPGEARFQLKLAPLSTVEFSLTSYIKALFTARTGRFRVIVFALSQGVTQDAAAPDAERAKTWATSGQSKLPARYAALAFSDSVTCTALIYEFEKKDYNADAQFVVPGKINGMSHLMKAGIWTLLGK